MCCRLVFLLLLMCVADSEARVVLNFGECPQFFYKDTRPLGLTLTGIPSRYEYICQHYKGRDYFATLYIKDYKIPLYSAYRLDEFSCESPQKRRGKWFIEPQLNSISFNIDMSNEFQGTDTWKNAQAVNEDYQKTNYDRGHLNPCFYQCDETNKFIFARKATFTLTNAVPQDPCFNQQKWKAMEQISKEIMWNKCNSIGAQRFFVTGVIPSNKTIPYREQDEENDANVFERVNVPYVMWTAACCYYPDYDIGFSFGYAGINAPESEVKALSITALQNILTKNGYKENSMIFTDNCFSSSENSKYAVYELAKVVHWLNENSLKNMGIDPSLLKNQPNYDDSVGHNIIWDENT